MSKSVPLTMRIRVDEDNELVLGLCDSALQGPCFPAIVLTNQSHARIDRRDLLHFSGGIITRTIIDHDNFQLALIVCFQKRLQCCRDDLALIVSSDDDTGGFGKIYRRRSTKAIGEVDHNKGTNDYQRGGNHHKGPEKFLEGVHDAETGAADVMRHRLSSG